MVAYIPRVCRHPASHGCITIDSTYMHRGSVCRHPASHGSHGCITDSLLIVPTCTEAPVRPTYGSDAVSPMKLVDVKYMAYSPLGAFTTTGSCAKTGHVVLCRV